jgi:type III secretion protein T
MVNFNALIELYRDFAFAIALIMPRMLGIFLVTPFLGANLIPTFIRNGIVIGLSFVIVPLIINDLHQYSFTDVLVWMILVKEFFIGLVVGFMIALFLYAVQSAGFIIDNQRGAAIASTVDPLLGQQTSPIGIFLTQVVTVYFFTSGLFLVFLGALYRSYILWPIFSFFPNMDFVKTDFFMVQIDFLFFLALMFAGPVVIAMFLSELALAPH